MGREELIALVERYFASVDGEDFDGVAATLTEDCVFTVETHGIRNEGTEAIEAMFRRLWADHKAVRHEDFTHVPAHEDGRIASRFTVVNTLHDGSQVRKSNCNFFEVRDGAFSRVAVYMAGENTLEAS